MEARADQSEVWAEVADRSVEMQSLSPTGAMSDIYETHRDRLAEIREGVQLHEGQCGSVAVIGGRIAMLDFVGRADAFAALQPAIVEGYALDALAHERSDQSAEGSEAVDIGTVRGFTLFGLRRAGRLPNSWSGPRRDRALRCQRRRGLGADRRGRDGPDDRLPERCRRHGDRPGPGPRAARINRPSRRRGR